jgi:hypothetical protein
MHPIHASSNHGNLDKSFLALGLAKLTKRMGKKLFLQVTSQDDFQRKKKPISILVLEGARDRRLNNNIEGKIMLTRNFCNTQSDLILFLAKM